MTKKFIWLMVLIAFFVGAAGSIFFDRALFPYLSSKPGLSFLSKLTTTSSIIINRREQVQIDEGVNITDLAKQASSFTVSIYTGSGANLSLAGAGIILTSDGVIMTSRNVVGNFKDMTVVLNDGRSFPGQLRALDRKSDAAIITITANNLPVAEFSDANNLQIGQRVFGLGTTSNDFTRYFNSGIVVRNVVNGTSLTKVYNTEVIEETFSASNEASANFVGGPIVDIEGKVSGMFADAAGKILTSEGLNQALSTYLGSGKIARPYAGIQYLSYSEILAGLKGFTTAGALVTGLDEASGAKKSGLRIGDYITAVEGQSIATTSFERLINQHAAGQTKITVIRDKVPTEIIFNLEAR